MHTEGQKGPTALLARVNSNKLFSCEGVGGRENCVLCGFFVRGGGGGGEGIINICTVSCRVQSRPLIELANRATRALTEGG